jgi:hypothetical protein
LEDQQYQNRASTALTLQLQLDNMLRILKQTDRTVNAGDLRQHAMMHSSHHGQASAPTKEKGVLVNPHAPFGGKD